jgi:hypothetical protein
MITVVVGALLGVALVRGLEVTLGAQPGSAHALQHLPEQWLSGGADPSQAAARRDLEGG